MTGIATALRLAKSGYCNVTLFEKAPELGGLSVSYTWENVTWDKFYHVVLSTDGPLREFINEIGVADQLFWKETQVGFYGDGKLVSMSSVVDFIRFPFLSLWQKFRLGLGILKSAGIKDPDKLDKIFVREWLTRTFGRRVYEKIWDPLLRSKLGEARNRTSAAFIWSTITRLYGARKDSGSRREQMGHVRGGYATILAAARKALEKAGVRIVTNAEVTAVGTSTESDGWSVSTTSQVSADTRFDRVIYTIPCSAILKTLKVETQDKYWSDLAKVEYLAIACVFLVLKKPLSPYYVTNLLDKSLPFTGVIEATNIVSPDELGGYHLIYLPKYMPGDDPVMSWDTNKIQTEFISALRKIHPSLNQADIAHVAVFRERYVQPLQEVNFLERDSGY